jgi:hypothetical protein
MKLSQIPLACICALTLTTLVVACGDDKDDKKEEATPTPTATATTGGGTGDEAKVLPAVYANACAGCHGADGSVKLKDTTLTEAAFVAVVKDGNSAMQPGLATEAESKQIYNYFKK